MKELAIMETKQLIFAAMSMPGFAYSRMPLITLDSIKMATE
jgi:hypothetical protein